MPIDIVMPKLGLTMTEGLIAEWRKKEGDPVRKGDILFVLETEKVTYEVEAPEDGVLGRILVPEQETVAVGVAVAYLLKPGESGAEITAVPLATQKTATLASASVTAGGVAPAAMAAGRPKASPLAKKVAREYGIDLATVAGTGLGGRVVREDVEKARTAVSKPGAAASPPSTPAPEDRVVAFTRMRRTIAKKMLQSKVESAQAYMSNTVDASRLQQCREILLRFVEKEYGVRLTITDIMMKITGAALREHPVINTRWTEKGILYLSEVHMGMAMALDEGLIVPVIRNINSKSLGQIALERTALINKGKTNSFLPDDITESTFTLSAMGMFGIEQFTPIINQPENAILGVAAIIDKPVAVKGQILIRPMMNVTLSYDHRTIDGANAAKFMQTLKGYIEEPVPVLG